VSIYVLVFPFRFYHIRSPSMFNNLSWHSVWPITLTLLFMFKFVKFNFFIDFSRNSFICYSFLSRNPDHLSVTPHFKGFHFKAFTFRLCSLSIFHTSITLHLTRIPLKSFSYVFGPILFVVGNWFLLWKALCPVQPYLITCVANLL